MSLDLLMPPSTLIEVVRLPNAVARQRIVRAIGGRNLKRLRTEASLEADELVEAIRRSRPHWMRAMPDRGRIAQLDNFWTKRIWREAKHDSQRLYDYQTRQRPVYDYIIETQKANKAAFELAGFNSRPLTSIESFCSPQMPVDYLGGWDGSPVEAWRLTSRDLMWHQLATVFGRSILTKEDTTYADWVGCYVNLARLRSEYASFTQLWLHEIALMSVPRNWLRWAINLVQTGQKVTAGNPADEQHGAYMIDADLFLSADRRYVDALEIVHVDAPFSTAKPVLVSGDRQVSILDRIVEAFNSL